MQWSRDLIKLQYCHYSRPAEDKSREKLECLASDGWVEGEESEDEDEVKVETFRVRLAPVHSVLVRSEQSHISMGQWTDTSN